MKQLKITINSEVKTFDLPENGEYKCEVIETYVPKVGDCVMVKRKEDYIPYWGKLTDVTKKEVAFKIVVNSRLETYENGLLYIEDNLTYTKITPEELKAKYAEAGYDWDYESDTIKPIQWVPKNGDKVWRLNYSLTPIKTVYHGNLKIFKRWLEKGLLFPTEEKCQKFADHCLEFIHNRKKIK